MRNLLTMTLILFTFVHVRAEPVTLVADGETRVCVVVDQAALDIDPDKRGVDKDLQLLHWAASDLGEYLEKMSGAKVAIAAEPAAGLLPIYVGNAPDAPALGVESRFGDAYLIDVTPQRIALGGESARAVHYAASTLLHELGVRWYGIGELGEHVPKRATLTVETGARESKPSFHTRNMWADTRWAIRNRMGGPAMAQGHAFYRLMDGRKPFDEHPEWFPMYGGKPIKTQANLSHPEVVNLFAKNLRAQLEKGTNWAGNGVAIGPDDGALLDERPESRAMDSGRIDWSIQLPSATDKFVKFCNNVIDQLDEDHPEAYFGFYVYSNHKLVPQTVKPHPQLFPIVAPITYNRYTSVGKPGAITMKKLEDNIKQWRSMVPRMGFYLYNFNLADVAMPFTRTLFWQLTLPRMHEWGIEYATVESLRDNWHHQVPGNYVASRLLWDVDANVAPQLDAFYPNYYGPAAAPMRRYNETLEQAYENTTAYAGSIWSMPIILGPIMDTLRAAIDEAEAAAKDTQPYADRVNIARHQLNFADHYLAARTALNEGRLAEAAEHAARFQVNYDTAVEKYPNWFGKYAWRYFDAYHAKNFAAAGRVAREGEVLMQLPDECDGIFDAERVGITDEWFRPGPVPVTWRKLRTYSATMAEQGNPFFRGYIWYRYDFDAPDAKTVHAFFSSIDDTAHVYLNGEHLGTHTPGRFGPLDLDITAALKRDAKNTLIVAVDNGGITELGSGGLMRPVFLYAPHAPSESTDGAPGEAESKPKGPLFTTD